MEFTGKNDIGKLIDAVNRSQIASVRNSIVEIIKVISNPRSNAKQLTEIIELDPPLTSRILRVANSPYYSSIRKIADIRQAIIRIGFDTIKELTLSQKVCELFSDEHRSTDFSRLELWKHSVAVGLCAKSILRKEFGKHGAIAFTAGILHDIGIIIEDQFLPDKFSEVLKKKKMMKDNLLNAENFILKTNHCEIASTVISQWGLPEPLIVTIKNHHNPASVAEPNYQLAAIVYVANYLIQKNKIGFSDTPFLNNMLFDRTIKKLSVSQMALQLIIEDIQNEIKKMEQEGWFENE